MCIKPSVNISINACNSNTIHKCVMAKSVSFLESEVPVWKFEK